MKNKIRTGICPHCGQVHEQSRKHGKWYCSHCHNIVEISSPIDILL